MNHPSGRKLCDSYQNLDKEGFPRSQLHPLHIGRGLVMVDVSLVPFLCAKEMNEQQEESETRFDYPES